MNFKDLPLAKKVSIGMVSIVLIFLIMGGVQLLASYQIKKGADILNDQALPQTSRVSDLRMLELLSLMNMRAYISEQNRKALSAYSVAKGDEYEKAIEYQNQVQSLIDEVQSQKGLSEKLDLYIDSLEYNVKQFESLGYKSAAMVDSLNRYYDEMEIHKQTVLSNFVELANQVSSGKLKPQGVSSELIVFRLMATVRMVDMMKGKQANNDEVYAAISKFFEFLKLLDKIFPNNQLVAQSTSEYQIYVAKTKEFYQKLASYVEFNKSILVMSGDIIKGATIVDKGYIKASGDISQKIADGTQSMYYSIAIGLVIIVILVFVIMSRIVVKAINNVINTTKGVEKISHGDLTTMLEVESKDELGMMSSSMNSMISKLKEIVFTIKESSKFVAAFSQEMNKTSQHMSQGANTQASSAQEVSASIEEMSAGIQQNSNNAKQTEDIAQKTLVNIKESSQITNKAVVAMRDIANKISIIDEIAFQTNILALNAAVEAARAGEHGKGFAVVASEVRKLAERSAEAASEIDQVSKEGVEISEHAGQVLASIIPDVEKTTDLVREISTACMEQSSGIEQINNAVQQLNKITQEYAASAEEMASTSVNLEEQSQKLNTAVQFFTIDNDVKKISESKKIETKPYSKKENATINKNKSNNFSNHSTKKDNESNSKGTFINLSDSQIDSDYEKF